MSQGAMHCDCGLLPNSAGELPGQRIGSQAQTQMWGIVAGTPGSREQEDRVCSGKCGH